VLDPAQYGQRLVAARRLPLPPVLQGQAQHRLPEPQPEGVGDRGADLYALLQQLRGLLCFPAFPRGQSQREQRQAEVQRLRFLAYCREQGYMRPPAAVRPGAERLCDEIAAYLRALPLRTPPQLQHTVAGGLPPLWRAWATTQQHPAPSAQVP
jgi:hypothetical protein